MGKRIFDLFGALVLLVVFAPCMLFIAVWVKLTSPGPVIFQQIRAGYRGKPFVLFKFRTMEDKSARPIDMVLYGDPRITVPGTFLRKVHFDELPQLVNVLLGQMSLVGPRPLEVGVIRRRIQEVPGYERRLEVLPGLTGLAQLYGRMWALKRGCRCTLRLDLFNIRHDCLFFNVYILFRTIKTVLQGKGV